MGHGFCYVSGPFMTSRIEAETKSTEKHMAWSTFSNTLEASCGAPSAGAYFSTFGCGPACRPLWAPTDFQKA